MQLFLGKLFQNLLIDIKFVGECVNNILPWQITHKYI